MPGPAARMGDQTAHGGTIVLGFPQVMIGGKPAARLMDMHVCPMLNPGLPPPPHVGGPISGPGVPTVLIGNMPAATVGDMAVCAGPPDVIIIGCPTVMIGMAGAGGGSAGAAGGGGGAGATASANAAMVDSREALQALNLVVNEFGGEATADWSRFFHEALTDARTAQGLTSESTTRDEHWIEFEFVDSAGLPVSGETYHLTDTEGKESLGTLPADGIVARDGIAAGNASVVIKTVYNARWSSEMVKVGESIKMSANIEGFEPGTKAIFEIYKRDVSGPNELIDTLQAETTSDLVEAEWTFTPKTEGPDTAVPVDGGAAPTGEPPAYSAPDYYFQVSVESCLARSGLLYVEDFIEIQVLDEDANPLKDEEYLFFVCNGEVREGSLDKSGEAREDRVPAGMCNLRLPKLPDVEYQE